MPNPTAPLAPLKKYSPKSATTAPPKALAPIFLPKNASIKKGTMTTFSPKMNATVEESA